MGAPGMYGLIHFAPSLCGKCRLFLKSLHKLCCGQIFRDFGSFVLKAQRVSVMVNILSLVHRILIK